MQVPYKRFWKYGGAAAHAGLFSANAKCPDCYPATFKYMLKYLTGSSPYIYNVNGAQ